ncbi:MAG: carbohydrate kinase family protein [Candidatus Marinimicrobia bacterium]|nr:carbohydrate kinase family protein [Candidatus Neomarinimicrobiota bacterium]MCF7829360.1 carbohydrate kinase family protein [Candidatus Neomarinimicrobiota bacterium]MCF7880846.1 carbohydrate kinase family protein [Candidatus Neomarinimicrobiota bacterium]
MQQFDVVVVGELNADLILQEIPSLPQMGKEILARNMTLTMGSASAILATNVARLGLKVGFSGKLGDDQFGNVVLNTLKERGVNIDGILVSTDSQTGVTVVLSYPEDYAMVTHMGAMATFGIDDVDFEYVKHSKHLHLSSYFLQPEMRKGAAELFRQAKDAGLTTSFDPGWDPDEEWSDEIYDLLQYVDVFMPNEQEAKYIAGESDIDAALDTLSEYCEVVMVTQGSRGSVCRTEGQTVRAGVFAVEPQDTTGAGDSFNAGFLSQWLAGEDIKKCITYGSACGAVATTKLGGSTASPTADEAATFLKNHNENIFE